MGWSDSLQIDKVKKERHICSGTGMDMLSFFLLHKIMPRGKPRHDKPKEFFLQYIERGKYGKTG